MTHNPYETPGADVQPNEMLPMRPVRGILYGLLIDLGGTVLVSTAITFAYAIFIGAQGASASEIENVLTSTDPSSALGVMQTLAGLGMSYLSGFYCLRVARGTNLRYPLVLALITLVFSVAGGLSWTDMGVSLLLGLSVIAFGMTLLGGVMALRPRT